MLNLLQTQLTCQHNHIGPLRVELRSLDVRDVALRGDMHLHTHLAGIHNGGNIGRNDGINTLLQGAVNNRTHILHLGIVEDGIDRKVGFYARLVSRMHDGGQVVKCEVHRRAGTHIQNAHTEIYGIGTRRDGSVQRLHTPHGGHNLYIFSFNHFHLFFFIKSPLWRSSPAPFKIPIALLRKSGNDVGEGRGMTWERVGE